MRDAVERLYRRVQLMVGIGRTTAPANDAGRVQTVQVRLSPDEVRDGTQVAGQFGLSSHAPVGSDVAIAATDFVTPPIFRFTCITSGLRIGAEEFIAFSNTVRRAAASPVMASLYTRPIARSG